MADTNAAPLTDDERSELEALRAEKARREAEEQAQRDRAELEALRAEQERIDAEILRERAAENAAAQAAREARAGRQNQPSVQPRPDKPSPQPDNLTFGQKMVLTPDAEDPDDVPGMAPAQKIIIALAAVCVVLLAVYIATR